MSAIALLWIVLPFFVGFSVYLLPALARHLAIAVALASGLFALPWLLGESSLSLNLIDSFGVSLSIDRSSGFFILTNALVTAAVAIYCWSDRRVAFFYTQLILLHGSINAVFVCADLISLYVALEVIGIAAFLLMTYPRSNQAIWVGLRYLFVSNTAMLFYLIGALLVYQSTHSFAFSGLAAAPSDAVALLFIGLLTKGGIFLSGLWLPLTHSESESPVSALLSGVTVKAGVFPLLRFAAIAPDVEPLVRIFGVGTACLGIGYAVFAKDIKRMLAFHTISQMGFVLAAPAVGGFYALSHGLVKSTLFLVAGKLPSRKFSELKGTIIATPVWAALAIASLSISGFPLLAGFGAKALSLKELLPWQIVVMNGVAIGTTISFSKCLFLHHQWRREGTREFWLAVSLLLVGLVLADVFYLDAYTSATIGKALVTIALGWGTYWLAIRRLKIELPRQLERLEHLIGMMGAVLVGLFWIAIA